MTKASEKFSRRSNKRSENNGSSRGSRHTNLAVPEAIPEGNTASFLTPAPMLVALLAGICWIGTLLLLLLFPLRYETGFFSPIRILFLVLVLSSGLLTFAPIQQRMGLPYLAVEGIGGMTLLCYTLAFVPPPTDWLLSLPELPVYGLLIIATFWSCSALVLPFVYTIRQKVVKQRVIRLNTAEARRQAYGIGILVACLVLFAGLRILTWISMGLLGFTLLAIEWLIQAHRGTIGKGEAT